MRRMDKTLGPFDVCFNLLRFFGMNSLEFPRRHWAFYSPMSISDCLQISNPRFPAAKICKNAHPEKITTLQQHCPQKFHSRPMFFFGGETAELLLFSKGHLGGFGTTQ